ncbi:MAG: RidA family protein [Actinobacteria bacterium]|nr:RidA family protein [Actinomycetota bacterium]
MNIIYTKKAPAAIGPYSQAIETESFIFLSGQLGLDPKTGMLAEGLEAQTEQAIDNISGILDAAGLGFEKVVKTTCFLTDMNDFTIFNGVYAKYFTGNPARSCVEVSALPKNALVEIEVIAMK